MSKARQLADLLDASGDVVTGALDNVPPSNNASLLTTGTLPKSVLASDSVLQVKSVVFSSMTTNATAYSYTPVNGSPLTLTTVGTNSKFLLIADSNGYGQPCNGVNLGFYRNSSLIRGYYPGNNSGDMWMSAFNGWGVSGALGMSKNHLDLPSLAAGTSVTYQMALGLWTGSFSINYAGYGATSSFTVIELAG